MGQAFKFAVSVFSMAVLKTNKRRTRLKSPRNMVFVSDLDGTTSASWKHSYWATHLTQNHFKLPHSKSRNWYRAHYCQENKHDALLNALLVKQNDKSEYLKVWFTHYTQIIRDFPPKLVKGFVEEFEFLHSLGMSIHLLTSTTPENVSNQLDMTWASRVFKHIYTNGKKTEVLVGLREQFPEKIIVSLGDTLSDGRASLAAGVFFAAMIHEQSNNLEEQLESFVQQSGRQAIPVHGFKELEPALAEIENTVLRVGKH